MSARDSQAYAEYSKYSAAWGVLMQRLEALGDDADAEVRAELEAALAKADSYAQAAGRRVLKESS